MLPGVILVAGLVGACLTGTARAEDAAAEVQPWGDAA